MKTKRIVSILITLCLVVSLLSSIIIKVEAAPGVTVEKDGAFTCIYANGNPITVKSVGGDPSKVNIYLNSDLGMPLDLQYLDGTSLEGDTTVGYTFSTNMYLFGGKRSSFVNSTNITMEGGTLGNVFTGGRESGGIILGDVQFTMTGGIIPNALYCGSNDTVGGNVTANISGGTIGSVFGSRNGNVNGSITMNVSGSAKITEVYGGGFQGTTEVASTRVNISGGTITNVYGGGSAGTTVQGNTNVTITGGTITGTVNGDGGTINGTKNGFFYANIDKAVDSSFTGTLKQTGNDLSVAGSLTVPSDMVVPVESGGTLTVPNGATLINRGTITNNAIITNGGTIVNYGIISGTGTISGTGMFSVTGITDVPTSMIVGTALALSGTVAPTNATNQTIVWSVKEASTTGASISGNDLSATNAGTVTVTATITNGATASTNYTQDFDITVNSAPVAPTITTTTLPNGIVGTAYSQTLTATGGATITWDISSGNLPAGLALSSNGIISGIPTTSGTTLFTAEATNGAVSNTKVLSIVIGAVPVAPTITTIMLPSGTVGSIYTHTLNATGDAIITWDISSGSLPTGLILAGNGLISGTPTTSGTFDFTVRATNSAGNNTKALSIVISDTSVTPTITTTTLSSGTVGTAYSQTLTATGDSPLTWTISVGSLPAGLTLSSGGAISGTPTATGTANFTIQATNSAGNNTKALSIVINAAPIAPTITTTALASGTVGTAYTKTLTATGDSPLTWTISVGSLPAGLTLSNGGVISGTPTAAGTVNFTLRATNSAGNNTKALSIVINAISVAPTITTTTLSSGTVGTTYSQTLTATGVAVITWDIAVGSLPAGLTLSSGGVISGTPTATGTVNFTLRATNSAGNNIKALSIVINAATGGSSSNNPTADTAWKNTVSQLVTANGSTVTHKMEGSTSLPTDILSSIAGKNATLVLDMGSYSWSIDCKTINAVPAGQSSYNLQVRIINESPLSTLVAKKDVVQIEILHNGVFNFTGVLKWFVGKPYAGKTIYLHYYNQTSSKLEQVDSAVADATGYVNLTFKHASKYVLTTSKELNSPTENPLTGVKDDIGLAVAISIAACGLAIFKRKKAQ